MVISHYFFPIFLIISASPNIFAFVKKFPLSFAVYIQYVARVLKEATSLY